MIYSCDSYFHSITQNVTYDLSILLKMFKINSMKPNPKKFQLKILGKNQDQMLL